jgi:hypothetical protein
MNIIVFMLTKYENYKELLELYWFHIYPIILIIDCEYSRLWRRYLLSKYQLNLAPYEYNTIQYKSA